MIFYHSISRNILGYTDVKYFFLKSFLTTSSADDEVIDSKDELLEDGLCSL